MDVGNFCRNVLLAESDDEARQSVQGVLRTAGHRVLAITEASNLVELTGAHAAEFVVLDSEIEGGETLTLVRALVERYPNIDVLVASSSSSVDFAVRCIKAGASDFLQKPFDVKALAARMAHPRKAPVVVEKHSNGRATPLSVLTQREHQVLLQIARGASSKEVGRSLGISPRTVDVHRARIKQKLNVRRAIDLVRLLYQSDAPKPVEVVPDTHSGGPWIGVRISSSS